MMQANSFYRKMVLILRAVAEPILATYDSCLVYLHRELMQKPDSRGFCQLLREKLDNGLQCRKSRSGFHHAEYDRVHEGERD
jgi:hypothetical protein